MEVLTAKDVASLLQVSHATVCKLARQGVLPAFRVGTEWRFERQLLEDWVRRQSARVIAHGERPLVRVLQGGRQSPGAGSRDGGDKFGS
jgi:excisionase family DNA binding protein